MDFPIPFTKMSGSGNDFIVIDNRQPLIDSEGLAGFVRAVCRRKFSVGADGVILIEPSTEADFSWTFVNADGSLAEMCGNGARCAARFAFEKGIAPAHMRFQTLAGIIEAEVTNAAVKIRMTAPVDLLLNRSLTLEDTPCELHSVNTGVPHAVLLVEAIDTAPVVEWGRAIRRHELFQPAGTNVNFVEVLGAQSLAVRTYERGVEDETMACGTGAVAAAIIAAVLGRVRPPVAVTTSGGDTLTIHFGLTGSGDDRRIEDVYLEGPAHIIYQGELSQEAAVGAAPL